MNDDRILTLRTAQVDDEALITRSQAKRLVSVSVQCDTFDFSIGTIASSMCHKAGSRQAVASSVSILAGILKIPAAGA